MKKVFGWFWRRKIISIVLIALIGVAVWWFLIRDKNGELEEATIARGEVVEEMILSGLVIADQHAKLTFPTGGKLNYIAISEGDDVYKGQFLASIDSTALNSAYERAQADLRAAEANVDAVHDSVKGNDTDETFDERNTRTAAEVAKDKAYEAVIVAQENLRDSKLYAPFDGYVTFVANPFPGVNALATQTQIEIINPETIHFEVAADQSEVIDIQIGEKVKIVLDALEDKEIEGEVTYVSYSLSADALSAVYEVKINFSGIDNSDFSYRIGMTGDAHFTLNKKDNVLYVPSSFIKSDEQGDYLLTNKGKDKVYIQVGLEGEERTEVSGEGLTEGMVVYD